VLATSSGQPVQHEHGAAPPRRATRSPPVPPLRLITTIAGAPSDQEVIAQVMT